MKTTTAAVLMALGGAVATAAAAKQQQQHPLVANILLPIEWQPSDELGASVVDVEPTATTFALGCPTKASDCAVLIPTITQGPMTWGYGGAWDNVQGVDEYTLRNDCKVTRGSMICTTAVTQVKDDVTRSTRLTGTTTFLGDLVHAIPITAGASKLATHTQSMHTTTTRTTPLPTEMPSPTSSPLSSTPVETPTVTFVIPTPSASQSDDATPTATPSVFPTDAPGAAAACLNRKPAMMAAVAAVVGAALWI